MIEALVLSFGLILARTGAFVAVLPVLGGATTPRMVKAGLALALAMLYWCALGSSPAEPLLARQDSAGWLVLGLALGREAVLGAFLGFALGLVLLPAHVAGEYLGQEMGLALGAQASPTGANQSAVVGQLFELVAAILFLGMDGHHLFLGALDGMFRSWPVGHYQVVPVAGLVTGLSRAQEWGLLVVAPLGAVLFLSTVVISLISRAVPPLNIFSVVGGLRVAAGLVGMVLFLPDLVRGLVRMLGQMGQLIEHLV